MNLNIRFTTGIGHESPCLMKLSGGLRSLVEKISIPSCWCTLTVRVITIDQIKDDLSNDDLNYESVRTIPTDEITGVGYDLDDFGDHAHENDGPEASATGSWYHKKLESCQNKNNELS